MTDGLDLDVGARLVIPVPVAPVRADPGHRSELISQWVLGETVTVEATDGAWIRARGGDGYAGWTPRSPFRHSKVEADAWSRDATWYSLGTDLAPTCGSADPSIRLERLPWGALVTRTTDSDDLLLPDGRTVSPLSAERIVPRPGSLEPSATAAPRIVDLARTWRGVPYLWGGRTELGVDCSGFVQSVFAAAGLGLCRDSRDQAAAHEDLAVTGSSGAAHAGDLLFFAPEGGAVTHVAISLGGSRIIHAASSNGCVREDDLEAHAGTGALLAASIAGHTRPLAG